MKRKMEGLMALTMAAALLAGCGAAPGGSVSAEPGDDTSAAETEVSTPAPVQENVEMDVLLYLPNEQADGFDMKQVVLDTQPQSIVGALVENGALPEGTELLSFHLQNDGITRSIALDLSKAYGDAAASMGTAGEYMLVGSLVNSMLSAYGAESVLLTVEGEALETGHNVYDEPIYVCE